MFAGTLETESFYIAIQNAVHQFYNREEICTPVSFELRVKKEMTIGKTEI
jgi:hypothetical protein